MYIFIGKLKHILNLSTLLVLKYHYNTSKFMVINVLNV